MIYNKPRDISFRIIPTHTPTRKKTEKKEKKTDKSLILKNGVFFCALFVGTFIAFIIPLRPTYSETEKRDLKEFPQFTADSLFSGSYFSDIGTWFSDTFPFREKLTKLNTAVKDLYGFDSVAIHGDIENGDDIPDIPLDIPVTQPPETTEEPETTEVPQTTEPPQTTQEPTSSNETEKTTKPDIKTQSMGAILVAGNSAYEYYNFSSKLAPDFISGVSNIKTAAHNKSNVYSLIVPTSMDIQLNDAIRADINTSDQKKALDYFNSSFVNVTAVSGIYDAERTHRDEYTYFRTDHHWTALGAYYAYEQFAYAKGITPTPIESYKTVSYDGFLGTFYSSSGQSEALGKTPDTVITYQPFNNVDCKITETSGNSYNWDVISDVSGYASNLKYLTFIGGDQPLVTIENRDITDGETCIVIKESYGNAFVPFLIPHYKTIYVIDPRHYKGTLGEFTADKNIDDIIFVANISTTRNSIYIDAMKDFIK